jgi:CheY-like chemotaxis protein
VSNKDKLPTILVVDDNEPNMRLLASYLESHGYETVASSTLPTAIQILEATPVSLVVSDQTLSDGKGIDLCRHVRDQFGSDVPFLLYTVAQITDDQRRLAHESGVDRFVHKTADLRQILEVVQELLDDSKSPA